MTDAWKDRAAARYTTEPAQRTRRHAARATGPENAKGGAVCHGWTRADRSAPDGPAGGSRVLLGGGARLRKKRPGYFAHTRKPLWLVGWLLLPGTHVPTRETAVFSATKRDSVPRHDGTEVTKLDGRAVRRPHAHRPTAGGRPARGLRASVGRSPADLIVTGSASEASRGAGT